MPLLLIIFILLPCSAFTMYKERYTNLTGKNFTHVLFDQEIIFIEKKNSFSIRSEHFNTTMIVKKIDDNTYRMVISNTHCPPFQRRYHHYRFGEEPRNIYYECQQKLNSHVNYIKLEKHEH